MHYFFFFVYFKVLKDFPKYVLNNIRNRNKQILVMTFLDYFNSIQSNIVYIV